MQCDISDELRCCLVRLPVRPAGSNINIQVWITTGGSPSESVYVWMHVCMHVCMYVSTHIYTCISVVYYTPKTLFYVLSPRDWWLFPGRLSDVRSDFQPYSLKPQGSKP